MCNQMHNPFPCSPGGHWQGKPDYSDITVTLETVALSLTGTSAHGRESRRSQTEGRIWLGVLLREYEAAPYLHCSRCSAAGSRAGSAQPNPSRPISPVRTCTTSLESPTALPPIQSDAIFGFILSCFLLSFPLWKPLEQSGPKKG